MGYGSFGFVTAALTMSVAANPAYASYNDQFTCDAVGDGSHMVMIYSDDPSKAMVQYILSGEYSAQGGPPEQVQLQQKKAASGMLYAGGDYEFHAKGAEAILSYKEEFITKCRFVNQSNGEEGEGEASADAAGSPYPEINVRAKSYGGKVRSGPGMNYDQIGSLFEGNRVTLLQNTGIAMNGYDWFRIKLPDGREGFQWGGLICSDELHIAGIYRACE